MDAHEQEQQRSGYHKNTSTLERKSAIEHRLWRTGHAWNAFQGVVDVCDYIFTESVQPEDRIYYSLITAISVLYARPFKRSHAIEKLTLEFVPEQFHHLHRELIKVRDKTSAHVDTGILFGERPANGVQLFVRNSGERIALGMSQSKFKLTAISQIRALAEALAKRMLDETRSIASEYPDELRDGDYEIDLTAKTLRRL